jgi:hypothetical protein
MPYKIRKLPGIKRYRVYSKNVVKAKNTTLAKARAQVRLLRAVNAGWRPSR